jgi:hypothetical protein
MKILGGFLICAVLVCSMGANPYCRNNYPYYEYVPTVVSQPITLYQPIVEQRIRMVPVVENRMYYRPLSDYYLNNRYYYPPVPMFQYEYRYSYDPWGHYNY